MQIKTITCHDVYNAGASLQAYALMTYLQDLGNEVEIIDYKPEYLSGQYCLWGHVSDRYNKPVLRQFYSFAKFPKRFVMYFSKRKKSFNEFKKNYLNITKKYTSFDELKKNPPKADIYIAGSDQIWNTFFENGKDPAFYLDFAPENSIKASYAASFATDNIFNGYEEKICNWINNLDHVSVRESSGLNVLNSIGITCAEQVVDPVFLLDRAKWEYLAMKWENPEKEPYLFVYNFENDESLANAASKLALENGWKVISFLDSKFFENTYKNEGPLAFLSLIMNAQAVISNSFHATAFSLIFNKEFWVFNRKERINTRMRDLLLAIELSERLENKLDLCSKISYSQVNKKIEILTNNSKEFILKIINGTNRRDIINDI